jgi:hypothetical protein
MQLTSMMSYPMHQSYLNRALWQRDKQRPMCIQIQLRDEVMNNLMKHNNQSYLQTITRSMYRQHQQVKTWHLVTIEI